ncbi:MAG: glutamine--tRNA ligase, partial [Defluviitaleaceae bacterium]|nr:glutamine--tRNA ligase [Defluviitaleaceae bacterium]
VKSTIHWVSCAEAVKANAMLFDYLVIDDDTRPDGIRTNENSLIAVECYIEPGIKTATLQDRYQFMRNGYFCLDSKFINGEKLIFNRIVEMKSSYKPPK